MGRLVEVCFVTKLPYNISSEEDGRNLRIRRAFAWYRFQQERRENVISEDNAKIIKFPFSKINVLEMD